MAAQRLLEGVAHAAADEQHVNLVKQVLDNADLVGNLRAAQNGEEGALGVLQSASPMTLSSLPNQETGYDSGSG